MISFIYNLYIFVCFEEILVLIISNHDSHTLMTIFSMVILIPIHHMLYYYFYLSDVIVYAHANPVEIYSFVLVEV